MSRTASIAGKPSRRPTATMAARPDGGSGRKIAQVTAAAWKVFVDHGYRDASMDAIAQEAGVSKATLYAYFPGKKALFAHLVVEECRKVQTADTQPDLSLGIPAALRSFARQYIRLFADRDPHRITFFRTFVPEVARFPELGQLMVDAGPRADAARLARLMADARERGLLSFADPLVAATQFLSLIRGELPIYSALGLPAPDETAIDKTIEDGLGLFLRACQCEPAAISQSGSMHPGLAVAAAEAKGAARTKPRRAKQNGHG